MGVRNKGVKGAKVSLALSLYQIFYKADELREKPR